MLPTILILKIIALLNKRYLEMKGVLFENASCVDVVCKVFDFVVGVGISAAGIDFELYDALPLSLNQNIFTHHQFERNLYRIRRPEGVK
jgi:hypothetical protein